jgi:signal transduction histidine kinase
LGAVSGSTTLPIVHRLSEQTLRRLLIVGRELVSDLDLETVLERVLEAAVEVTDARYAALGVLDEERSGLERFLHHGIDVETAARIGDLPHGRGVLGVLIAEPRTLRLPDVSRHPQSYGFPENHPPMRTFLGVPITIRGERWGNLYLTEKAGGREFDAADERAAEVLAEWAAVAIGNARSVAADRLRLAIEAAEQERLQWARELHDETLQGLAAIRMMLAAGHRAGGERLEAAIARSLEQIDAEIAVTRELISSLRPESLKELGIGPALAGLARRLEKRHPGTAIVVEADARVGEGLTEGAGIAVYRIAQEAVNNAIKHGEASRVGISLQRRNGERILRIVDDGHGFDPDSTRSGYGLIGMRERAELARGSLAIDSAPGQGTTVRLELVVQPRPASPISARSSA